MRGNGARRPTQTRGVVEGGLGVEVDRVGEGVEIRLVAGLVGPAVKRDPRLVGGVGAGHPVGVRQTEIGE